MIRQQPIQITCFFLLAGFFLSPASGCHAENPMEPPIYNPCANKGCGEECTLCDPADPDCVETGESKFCNTDGVCEETIPNCEPDCIDLSVSECEAAGCELFMAFPYDEAEECHLDEEMPAFCMAEPEIVCGWQGYPVILTEPDGTTWYVDWSCFTIPDGWSMVEVPDGTPECGEESEYDPCEDKSCGEECTLCDPADPDCVETGESKFCNMDGVCEATIPDCEPDCIDLSVSECEAAGCELFMAFPYDETEECRLEEETPAFCRADPDIVCFWEGHPAILTEPDGTTWYTDWSCFLIPDGWDMLEVPDGTPECNDSP